MDGWMDGSLEISPAVMREYYKRTTLKIFPSLLVNVSLHKASININKYFLFT